MDDKAKTFLILLSHQVNGPMDVLSPFIWKM